MATSVPSPDALQANAADGGVFGVTCAYHRTHYAIWATPPGAEIEHTTYSLALLRLRVEDGTQILVGANDKEARRATFVLPDGFTTELAQGETLVIEASIVDQGKQVFSIDLDGASEALKQVGCEEPPVVDVPSGPLSCSQLQQAATLEAGLAIRSLARKGATVSPEVLDSCRESLPDWLVYWAQASDPNYDPMGGGVP